MKLATFLENETQISALVVDVDGASQTAQTAQLVHLPLAFAWLERERGKPSDASSIARTYGETVLAFVEQNEVARPAADGILLAHAEK